MNTSNQGGSTGKPIDAVFVIDKFPHFQPIRLPAEGLYRLHQSTGERLEEFVDLHMERFPQVALGVVPRGGR